MKHHPSDVVIILTRFRRPAAGGRMELAPVGSTGNDERTAGPQRPERSLRYLPEPGRVLEHLAADHSVEENAGRELGRVEDNIHPRPGNLVDSEIDPTDPVGVGEDFG